MKRSASLGLVGAMVAAAVVAVSSADGQAPAAPGEAVDARPRQPGGLLSDRLGEYLTIEGILVEEAKVETNTLLVDTIDGRVLVKPISIAVRGYAIVDHNLREAKLVIEPKRRYVLKGYEDGSMIGVADAVREAAKEKGWREIPVSPVEYSWRPYFVALIVDEPAGLSSPRNRRDGGGGAFGNRSARPPRKRRRRRRCGAGLALCGRLARAGRRLEISGNIAAAPGAAITLHLPAEGYCLAAQLGGDDEPR